MELPVNILKISPPHLPKILYRSRLLNLLEKNRDKKLILIMGQAAQGKTTLVASYIKTSKIPTAWLNLDQSDSDPFNLYRLIVQSLQYTFKEMDFAPLLSESKGMMNPGAMIPLFQNGADFISKNVSDPVQIVFDGLDRLFQDSLPFECLQKWMEGLPPQVHLMMLSRGMPPLSFEFQNPKIRQEALILSNEDLAFTEHEVKEFFQEIKKVSLDENQIRKIYGATEGWIGGLILFSESLLRLPDASREKYITQELPHRFNKDIFQYFGKEILSSQPKEVQQFLLKSSTMEIIEPHFVKELFGIDNAEEILRDHVKRNLFVQSFYDEKTGWVFRYNHMFRNFLKGKYLSETTPEERTSFLLKVGNLCQQKGKLENAIKYFLEGKAYSLAIPLIESSGMALLSQGRKSELISWIDPLPQSLVQKNPWLLFYQSMAKQFTTGKENVISLQKAYQLFKQIGETRGELLSLAQLILTITQTGIHLSPIQTLIQRAEALLESEREEAFKYEKATLWYCMAQAYLLAEGDIRKGIQASENAYLMSREIHDIPLQAYALVSSATGFICVGEFSHSEEALKKLETLAEKIDYHKELKAMNLMIRCVLLISKGNFEKAYRLSKTLQMGIEKHGFIAFTPWVYEITGYLRLARGDLIDAEQIGIRYVNLTRSLKNAFLQGLAFRILGLIYLHQKDFHKAREMIDQATHTLSKEALSRYHLNRVRVISGLICHEIKEVKRGEKELNQALQYFSSISSYHSLVETHLSLAFLKWDQKKREEAAYHLAAGFRMAAEKKYQYFYTLGEYYFPKACLLALELKVEEAFDYREHLLPFYLSPFIEEELKKLSTHSDPSIREKVWEIRRRIHRSKVPRLRIGTLGGLCVFRNDLMMDEKEWDRNQPKQLFKAILAHGLQHIPRESLIDDLWPDEKIGTGEKNFKTTLQRLRRSLEPVIDNEFGSSYILLNENLVSFDQELVQIDIDLFLSLALKGEENEKKGNHKDALFLYLEALTMYKGDFLIEDIYAPWAEIKREELRNKYLELLVRTARLYDHQGSLKKAAECYKKAIQVDPLLEETYQSLMTFYLNRRIYNEALKTYEACKKALKTGLNTKPDPMTTAIYQKVLEKIDSTP